MRRAFAISVRLACVGALALAMGSALPASGASTNVVVSMTVPSATTLTTCASGQAGSTALGVVLPDTNAVSTSDCAITFGSSNDTAVLKAWQSDLAGSAMHRPTIGQLDGTFSGDGLASVDTGGGDNGQDVDVANDDSVAIAGSNGTNFTVVRLTAAGAALPGFGTSGVATATMGGGVSVANAVLVQPDSKVLLAGFATVGTSDFAIARLTTTGGLDGTWGTGGRAITDIGTGTVDVIHDIALQPDGKVVAAGTSAGGIAIVRYTATGQLDTTFATGGKFVLPLGAGSDYANGVTIMDDGRIVAGLTIAGATAEFGAVRLTEAGIIDPTFNGGAVYTFVAAGSDSAEDVAVDSTGRILVAGTASSDFGVIRLLAVGTPDFTFNGTGRVTRSFAAGTDSAHNVFAQPDGTILVSGTSGVDDYELAFIRLRSDGSTDPSIPGGVITAEVGTNSDYGRGAALRSDGGLAVGGGSWVADMDFSVAVFRGVPIPDFSGSWATSHFGMCLQTLTSATPDAFPVAGSNNCTVTQTANWRAVPNTTGAASRVATTASGVNTAQATFRFGVRTAANQPPGAYIAPVTFELLAPQVP